MAAEDDTLGPIFIKEPPNRIDFSNTTGAQVECTARGSPNPEIIWIRSDGTAVGDVPGLRKVSAPYVKVAKFSADCHSSKCRPCTTLLH